MLGENCTPNEHDAPGLTVAGSGKHAPGSTIEKSPLFGPVMLML